jgi:hypothetical protein
MKEDGLRQCSRTCMREKAECSQKDCRLWIDFPKEYNCTLVSVYEHGPMTLREVAEREHLSFARIKQIETKALKKLKTLNLISCFRF